MVEWIEREINSTARPRDQSSAVSPSSKAAVRRSNAGKRGASSPKSAAEKPIAPGSV